MIAGCRKCSPGCDLCYALRDSVRMSANPKAPKRYDGVVKQCERGYDWSGRVNLDHDALMNPLRWHKERTVFVCSMSDWCQVDVPNGFRDRMLAVMALAHDHTFLVLTKRARIQRWYLSMDERANRVADEVESIAQSRGWQGKYIANDAHDGALAVIQGLRNGSRWPLPNVWVGVTGEDEMRFHGRVRELLHTPAAIRWVSIEPMIEPIDVGWALWRCQDCGGSGWVSDGIGGEPCGCDSLRGLDWVVVGGESGPEGRTRWMDPDWAREVLQDCRRREVSFYCKQMTDHAEMPGDLLVHEWPR